jgi:hypothetical protein
VRAARLSKATRRRPPEGRLACTRPAVPRAPAQRLRFNRSGSSTEVTYGVLRCPDPPAGLRRHPAGVRAGEVDDGLGDIGGFGPRLAHRRHGAEDVEAVLDGRRGKVGRNNRSCASIAGRSRTSTGARIARLILPIMPGVPERQTHNYVRQEFLRFLRQVASAYLRVELHLVVYNYATQNLAEIFFRITIRQAIRRSTFGAVQDLIDAITAFIDGSNRRCKPFARVKGADTIIAKACRKPLPRPVRRGSARVGGQPGGARVQTLDRVRDLPCRDRARPRGLLR